MSGDEARKSDRGDLALLSAAASGDRAAFDEFVARHRDAVYRFARALADSGEHAEEILQTAFIDSWRGANTFTGTGSARSWLFSIARNAANRSRRRRAGEPEVHEDLSELGSRAGFSGERLLSTAIAEREWVERALATLPADDQALLLVVDVEGYAVREAAALFDVTVAAAKSRLHRARLKLMAALRQEETR